MALRTSQKAGNSGYSSRKKLRLLTLPLEVRQQIYEHLTTLPRVAHLNFLCTCKSLHFEALHSFFSRPLNASHQMELMHFILRKSQGSLRHIKEVNLRLVDIDSQAMAPYLSQVVLGTSKTVVEHPYELELRRITIALGRLSNIRRVSIVSPGASDKNPAPQMIVEGVLEWVAQNSPKLHHLRVDSSNVLLEPLRSCRSLRSLCISAFAPTTASRAEAIFDQLPDLVDLEIIASSWQSSYFMHQTPTPAITPEVIRGLRPLQSLTIHDCAVPYINKAIFLDVDMVRVIGEVHGASLTHFSVSSTASLEPWVSFYLAENLRVMTRVHTLSLILPIIDFRILDCLPPTLWSLELLVSGLSHAQVMIDKLQSLGQQLPVLRRVKFVTSVVLPQAGVSEVDSGTRLDVGFNVQKSGRRGDVPWTVTWSALQSFS